MLFMNLHCFANWILFISLVGRLDSTQAQNPWKVANSSRYTLSFYKLKKNFSEAKKACEAEGMHLVKVNDESITYAIDAVITISNDKSFGYWIGASDSTTEGSWIWTDGTEAKLRPNNYQNWYSGEWHEPNGERRENCAGVGYLTKSWIDESCSGNNYYICQSNRALPVRITTGPNELTFYGFKNSISSSAKTFAAAQQDCANKQSRLVEIVNQRIYDAILLELNYISDYYWSGGNDIVEEGIWRWNDGDRFVYNQWENSGEPNGGRRENCLRIGQNFWADISCTRPKPYICEQAHANRISVTATHLSTNDLGVHTVQCNASGFPLPFVVWIKDGVIVPNTREGSIYQTTGSATSILNYTNAKLSDEGEYICSGYNQIRQQGYTVRNTSSLKVPSVPSIDSIEPNSCNSSLLISWTPQTRAVGNNHSISFTNTQTGIEKTKLVLPQEEGSRMDWIEELSSSSSYDISITPCTSTCIQEYETTIRAITGGIPNAVTNPSVIGQEKNQSCAVSWSWPESTSRTIISGHKITVESTLIHTTSRNNFNILQTVESNASGEITTYSILTLPNRNYSVKIQARTCAGLGPMVTARGECVTRIGAASSIAMPSTETTVSSGTTRMITLEAPDESNGPISCLFVIVSSGNTSSYSSNDSFIRAELDRANGSASGSDAGGYISVAVRVASLPPVGSPFKVIIGNGSASSCDLFDINQSKRRKRDTTGSGSSNLYVGNNPSLEKEKSYSVYIVSATPSGDEVWFQKSPKLSFIQKQTQQANLTIILPVIGVLVFLFLSVLLLVLIMRRRKNKESNGENTSDTMASQSDVAENMDMPAEQGSSAMLYENCVFDRKEEKRSETDIVLKDFEEIYNSMLRKNNELFLEQFQNLSLQAKSNMRSTVEALKPTTKKKNRYKNILPYDGTRVIIQNSETGYINASYINGYEKERKFIATQGPLPGTVNDFWLMVLEQRCGVIVMLAKCVEAGKKKCEKYWPDCGKTLEFGQINVKNEEEVKYGGFIRRTLHVSSADQTYENWTAVYQYQFLKWPDHGIPPTTSNLIRMHKEAMKTHDNFSGDSPILIHCSAGAGRTGTFIGFDILSEESKEKNRIDVFNCVLNMRSQRVEMVQNCDQYILVHKLVLEFYLFKETDIGSGEVEEKLSKVTSNKAIASKEFSKLSKIGPMKSSTNNGKLGENKEMNRSKHILPYDHTEVKLVQQSDDKTVPYINASWIESYDESSPMIAAQAPMESTVEYFWRAVIDNNVNTIVMLTDLSDEQGEQCAKYWPLAGRISVQVIDEKKSGAIVERKLNVAKGNIMVNTRSQIREQSKVVNKVILYSRVTVTHLQYIEWSSATVPKNGQDIVDLFNRMQASTSQSSGGAALIHCSDGAGRTGLFCAIVNLIERLKCENRVDVFRAVKDLRDCRPGMVQTLDQYIFCYKAVVNYLRSFDLYSNFEPGMN